MSEQKLAIPKGVRDFGPEQMQKRKFIFSTIEKVFQKSGYAPLETPSMENLSVLTGKYGDEGDQLLFRILNSGDFLSGVSENDLNGGAKTLSPLIAEKGLRYDLTVPFARYVVMNRHNLVFPFRRYQIQPVWRADRPQKGRYREFHQCDADVVGTDSLICEAEIIAIINEAFEGLGISAYSIRINNRKILTGITEVVEAGGKENDFCVAIDKLDKIGLEKVIDELKARGFTHASIEKMQPVFQLSGTNEEKLIFLKEFLKGSETGLKGVEELEEVFELANSLIPQENHTFFDITLARGLSYYTGAIFEVKAENVQIGSVGGGGRYDNLTGVFGLPGLSGVGFSFGVDRLYDVMETLNLFPEQNMISTRIMIAHFDEASFRHGLPLLSELRRAGIAAEIYPEQAKLKKQLNYANKKNIPFVIVIGSQEMESKKYVLKDMLEGKQELLTLPEIIRQTVR